MKTGRLEGKWAIRGQVIQQKPYFAFPLKLTLENGAEPVTGKVDIATDRSTPFELISEKPPRKLVLDPDVHILRRLFDKEIPPAINSLKSAPSVLFLIAENAGRESLETAETLALSLGLKNYEIVSENRVGRSRLAAESLIIFGDPGNRALLGRLPA